eukprot:Awhi_evm1s9965
MFKSLAVLAIASKAAHAMHIPEPIIGDVYEALELGDDMCTEFDEIEYAEQNWDFQDDLVEVYDAARRSDDPRLWPDNTLVYEVTDKVRNTPKIMNDIEDAIEMIEAALGDCIKVRERQPNEKSYVSIDMRGSGCSSAVGRRGGKQGMNLAGSGNGRGCGKGSTAHEMFHALGMYHGQSRPDRDELITVHENRIQDSKKHNFRKRDVNTFGSPYDFRSIMHYGSTAFAIQRGQATMTRKSDGGTWRANRNEITQSDIQFLRGAYKCDAGVKPPVTQKPKPTTPEPPAAPKLKKIADKYASPDDIYDSKYAASKGECISSCEGSSQACKGVLITTAKYEFGYACYFYSSVGQLYPIDGYDMYAY